MKSCKQKILKTLIKKSITQFSDLNIFLGSLWENTAILLFNMSATLSKF